MLPGVCDDVIGTIKDPTTSTILRNDSKSVFLNSRIAIFPFWNEFMLESLIKKCSLKPVDYSEWQCPAVIVPKPNDAVRGCGA